MEPSYREWREAEKNKRKRLCGQSESTIDFTDIIVATCAAAVSTTLLMTLPLEPYRMGNLRGERANALQYARSWDDDMFKRQFRISRQLFGAILTLIAPLIQRNEKQAICSSGSSVNPEMRLMITLRILAGASYLDMIWFHVAVNSVVAIAIDCCKAMDASINNIKIPSNKAEWR